MKEVLGTSLRRVLRCSLEKTPEEMLQECLQICIELAGASGGSILGEEGPHLLFLFSNVPELIGMKVPWTSIAGTTARQGTVIYTYAPSDTRHHTGVDSKLARQTRYLLSVPIPSVHTTAAATSLKTAGVLQLLFDENLFPQMPVEQGAQEFSLTTLEEQDTTELLSEVLLLLPHVAFSMEVMRLRQTSYQVIHELKNKMVAVQSWLTCLREDLGDVASEALQDENVAEDMDYAETAAREGSELSKSYLQFTKLYLPRFEDADVNEIVRATSAAVQAFADENGGKELSVVAEVDEASPRRQVDVNQIKMALFNLGKNAVEALVALAAGKGEVRLRSAQLEDGRLQLVVSDNGPGMPEEIASNLFVPFKTKKEGGTGLGLTITKKIVDIHGGHIRCETSSDGTRFVLEF